MFGNSLIIIWVKPNSLEVMTSSDRKPAILTVPETAVANLEIVNRDQIHSLVQDWAKGSTYRSAEIVWVLDQSVIFDKLLTDSKQDWDLQTVQFLDTVPFESVVSRVYHPKDGERWVVAANKDLLTAYVHAFAILGYNSAAEIPAKLVAEPILSTGLSDKFYKYVDSHRNELGTSRLLIEDEAKVQVVNKAEKPQKASKSQLPLLLGVFGVLLLVLVALLIFR